MPYRTTVKCAFVGLCPSFLIRLFISHAAVSISHCCLSVMLTVLIQNITQCSSMIGCIESVLTNWRIHQSFNKIVLLISYTIVRAYSGRDYAKQVPVYRNTQRPTARLPGGLFEVYGHAGRFRRQFRHKTMAPTVAPMETTTCS